MEVSIILHYEREYFATFGVIGLFLTCLVLLAVLFYVNNTKEVGEGFVINSTDSQTNNPSTIEYESLPFQETRETFDGESIVTFDYEFQVPVGSTIEKLSGRDSHIIRGENFTFMFNPTFEGELMAMNNREGIKLASKAYPEDSFYAIYDPNNQNSAISYHDIYYKNHSNCEYLSDYSDEPITDCAGSAISINGSLFEHVTCHHEGDSEETLKFCNAIVETWKVNTIQRGIYTLKEFSSYYPKVYLEYPTTWAVKQVGDSLSQLEYSFTKGEYELSIRRLHGDGAECHFDNNFPPDMTDFNVNITQYDYNTIESGIGKVYYFTRENPNLYEYCIPNKNDSDDISLFSNVGIVTFETPIDPDPEIMKEMEGIIGSLEYLI